MNCRWEGIRNSVLEGDKLILAPMAGVTDAPFRLICFQQGADVAVTEMVSSEGLIRDSRKTAQYMARKDGEGPVGVQLFGSDPEVMAEAAVMAAESGPAFIDINFGCPAGKVVRKNCGAALMLNPGLMGRICRRVAEAVDIPVTGKIRSGWSGENENYIRAGKILQDNGAAAVIIHPRYRQQAFSGEARWSHIAELNRVLSIPVIANGDVCTPDDYKSIVRRTGCTMVMMGRGALGNPWIFREIRQLKRGEEITPVSIRERVEMILRHVRMEVEWKGERRGVLEMRKHYRWYLRGIYGARKYREELSRSRSLDQVVKVFESMIESRGMEWKRPA